MGVQINQENLLSKLSERCGKIDGRGRLPHASLLVDNRDDLRLPHHMPDRGLVFEGFKGFRRRRRLFNLRRNRAFHHLDMIYRDFIFNLVLNKLWFVMFDSLGWFFVSFETIE